MIDLFDPKDTRSVIADWVELTALASSRGIASWADLVRSQQVRDDADHVVERDDVSGEDLDGEITDSRVEELAFDVGGELQYRAETLGQFYPFEFSLVRSKWTLRRRSVQAEGTMSAALTYTTCLLISGFRRRMLQSPNTAHTNTIADCMQRLSHLVAAEIVGGHAHWFGWPRPDSTTTMRAGLEALVEKFGQGVIKADDPEWASGYEKDGGVDIVAWRRFRDGRPGSVVVYGQVASGLDWPDKPISAESLKAKFNDWFVNEPSVHYLPATFIPFMQHDDCVPRKSQSYEQVMMGKARQNEIMHGLVIDRLRLCELAAEAEERRQASAAQDAAVREWVDASLGVAVA
jgi:hypothetical protein